jgi:hypothetical protein
MDEQDLETSVAMAVEQDAGARLLGHDVDRRTVQASGRPMRAMGLAIVVLAVIMGVIVGS